MDFLTKVGNTISGKGKVVASTITGKSKDVAGKVKEVAGVASLNAKILAKEDQIKSVYIELGKYVYENHKEDIPEEIADQFAAIDSAVEEIEKMKEEIRTLKGVNKCPECGKEAEKYMLFCPYCGAKMPEEPVEVVDEGDVTEVVEEAAEEVAEAVEEAVEAVEDAVENAE